MIKCLSLLLQKEANEISMREFSWNSETIPLATKKFLSDHDFAVQKTSFRSQAQD